MNARLKPHSARLRFYAELNDFLPAGRRQRSFEQRFDGSPAVKDLIEGMGVPHTQVDLILVNGVSVGFGHRVQDGDRIAIYPVFESLDLAPLQRLRPAPLRETRFLLDAHLGRLAKALRFLGFDSAYEAGVADDELIARARSEHRIILTRDRELLKARTVTHGYWLRATDTRQQLLEVLDRFDLRRDARPFSRCSVCNGELIAVDAREVAPEVPPHVRDSSSEYFRCNGCGKLYWQGTHVPRLEAFVSWALESSAEAGHPEDIGDAAP